MLWCIATGQISDIYILRPRNHFFEVSEATRDTLHLGPGRILFQKDTYIFQKIPPFMTFRNSDGVRIHLATAK